MLIFVCCVQAAAIAMMLPLKEVVPYTVLVDKQTGYVETARGVKIGDLAEDQAIVESMLAQYVLARETFDPADFAERYDRVALWSLGPARDQYVAQYQAGAADSILGGLRPGHDGQGDRQAHRPADRRDGARAVRDRSGATRAPTRCASDWQAVVSFRFTGQPMRTEDRLLNPLGFQVTGYRRDSEIDRPSGRRRCPGPPLRQDFPNTLFTCTSRLQSGSMARGAPAAPAEGARR